MAKITKKEKAILKEFKKELASQLANDFVSAKLFGSKARGDATKHSDIDVLVVLRSASEKNINTVYDIVAELSLQYDFYTLSVKVFSKKEFNYLAGIPTIFMRYFLKDAVSF